MWDPVESPRWLSWFITQITMTFWLMILITMVHGVHKPSDNWRARHCKLFGFGVMFMDLWQVRAVAWDKSALRGCLYHRIPSEGIRQSLHRFMVNMCKSYWTLCIMGVRCIWCVHWVYWRIHRCILNYMMEHRMFLGALVPVFKQADLEMYAIFSIFFSHNWLVVDLPLWKILFNWDDYSQYMGK